MILLYFFPWFTLAVISLMFVAWLHDALRDCREEKTTDTFEKEELI